MNRRRPVPRPKLRAALGGVLLPGQFRMPPKHPGCGKRRCATEEQAIAYALHMTRKARHALRYYHCPACDGWHLTKLHDWKEPDR